MREKNPWEMTIAEAAEALHMTPYDLKCKMRHGEISIGFATVHEGRKVPDYKIYRKKVMELKEELGIP